METRDIIRKALNKLEKNQDLEFKTPKDKVIDFLESELECRFKGINSNGGLKLTKKEELEIDLECSVCGTENTRRFSQDCDDCGGDQCGHMERKDNKPVVYCCECGAKKNNVGVLSLQKGIEECPMFDCSNKMYQKKGDIQTVELLGGKMVICSKHKK